MFVELNNNQKSIKMITWKSVNNNTPSNAGKLYPNNPDTPFISCIVWVCNPEFLNGGVIDVIRWDSLKKCWHPVDMVGKWVHEYPYKITHFCDDINKPTEI